MQVKSVRDADVKDKRVLVRVDFNVPLKDGKIADETRIVRVLQTIQLLIEKGAKEIIILTHLGRPEGKPNPIYSLAPVEAKFKEHLNNPAIRFHENLRFDPGEEGNSEEFAKKLASQGDAFVNDAFAVSHRMHASIVGIPKFLPSYAGLLVEEEVEHLHAAFTAPHPSVAIIGGAKLSTKAPLIEKFAAIYDNVLIGGAIANEYKPFQKNVQLPVDGIRDETHIADIGSNTVQTWVSQISAASFVLWNGPVGMYEDPKYKGGTDAIAAAIARSSAHAVLGGGDTAAAIAQFNFDRNKVFISTGGGAMLQFLIDNTLPGLEALKQ